MCSCSYIRLSRRVPNSISHLSMFPIWQTMLGFHFHIIHPFSSTNAFIFIFFLFHPTSIDSICVFSSFSNSEICERVSENDLLWNYIWSHAWSNTAYTHLKTQCLSWAERRRIIIVSSLITTFVLFKQRKVFVKMEASERREKKTFSNRN